jgi:hypothetical protein
MRFRSAGRAALLAMLGGATACGLAITGTGASPDGAPGSDAALPDALGSDGGGGGGSDGAADGSGGDASPTDAGSDAVADCPDASTTFASGTLTVPPAAAPVSIDGDLAEWKCARFFTYDAGTAAVVSDAVSASNVYSFAVAWDPSYVYVAAHVLDSSASRGTYTGAENYKNDAIEVYLGGDSTYTISYTSKDHQYVVDWANRAWDYTPSGNGAPPSGFTSAAKSSAAGFDVELRVPASEVGLGTLAASTKLGFAFAADEHNGTNQHGWALWYAPTVSCNSGCCQVWCDARYFGGLLLGP